MVFVLFVVWLCVCSVDNLCLILVGLFYYWLLGLLVGGFNCLVLLLLVFDLFVWVWVMWFTGVCLLLICWFDC